MGQEHSHHQGTAAHISGAVSLADIEGFQISRLLPNSPAHQAGFTPYFDVITGIDHVALISEEPPLLKNLKASLTKYEGKKVCFTLYNTYIRAFRDVYCTPTAKWGGSGLLGCTVEWVNVEECLQRCWHITDLQMDSPAYHCPDLRIGRDFILGMQQPEQQQISLLRSDDDFASRMEAWERLQTIALERRARYPDTPIEVPHTLLFLVYDSEANCMKEVLVEMGEDKGSRLGVMLSSGLLHLIPSVANGDATSLPVVTKFYVPSEPQPVEGVALGARGDSSMCQDTPSKGIVSPSLAVVDEGTRVPETAVECSSTTQHGNASSFMPPQSAVAVETVSSSALKIDSGRAATLPDNIEVSPAVVEPDHLAAEPGEAVKRAAPPSELPSPSHFAPQIPPPLQFPLFTKGNGTP